METALMIVQFLGALAAAGKNIVPYLKPISDLIDQRRTEGGTITKDDLLALFTAGDKLEAQARKQFLDTLADPNTPPA